jgi:hypothetical protein
MHLFLSFMAAGVIMEAMATTVTVVDIVVGITDN